MRREHSIEADEQNATVECEMKGDVTDGFDSQNIVTGPSVEIITPSSTSHLDIHVFGSSLARRKYYFTQPLYIVRNPLTLKLSSDQARTLGRILSELYTELEDPRGKPPSISTQRLDQSPQNY